MLEITNDQTIQSKNVNHLIEFLALADVTDGSPFIEQENNTGTYQTVYTFSESESQVITIGPGVKYRVKTNGGKLWINYEEGCNFIVSQ